LKEIQGRSTDFVIAADGTVMHGLALIYILRDLPTVGAFKIIQDSLSCTRVQVVTTPGYNDADEIKIREGLQARLGLAVDIQIEILKKIPPEKSGKHRYVVSHVEARKTP
jgi:phenylacetate-CoA ligase